MKILNIGSLNYDKVYEVCHFVKPKETLIASNYNEFIGGKGLNQSVALAKAGALVYHAGRVGQDGDELIDCLKKRGVKTDLIIKDDKESGHAIIQNCDAQNCIIINQGANGRISKNDIDYFLKDFESNDILLLQNETSNVGYAIKKAKEKGMLVCFNAAPMNDKVFTYPLEMIDIIIVNEVEGKELSECSSSHYDDILKSLSNKYPNAKIVLTVGKDGSYYKDIKDSYYQPPRIVEASDTTAAGDTFVGYFLKTYLKDYNYKEAMIKATIASSLSVMQKGAVNSIPSIEDVNEITL